MTPESDPVVVIGGGIAGAAACLRLQALGVEGLWLAPESSQERKPGEHLAPAARTLLERLKARDLLERRCHRAANAMISAWGSEQLAERNAIVHLEGPATVVDRVAFERDLVQRALEGGVERVAAMVQSVSRRDGLWHLRHGKGETTTRFVLDASGRAAIVGRAQAQRFRCDQLVALYAFLDRDPDSDVEPTRATLIEATADGWWYAAYLADGRLALNYYSDPDLLPPGATRDTAVLRGLLADTLYVGRWMDEAAFQLQQPPRLASAGTTWIAPAAGEGWVAIGDAASAFDPLSSHGMTTALWTAVNAAEAAAAALDGDERPLRTYASQVAMGVQQFLESRADVYGLERRFQDRPFWQRRRLAIPI